MFRFLTLGIFTLFALGCSQSTPSTQPPALLLVGDSTMAAKKEERRPETGWGEALAAHFVEGVSILNHAANGRSTKSFIDEGRWQAGLASIGGGDYVLIEFGHNDEKEKDPSRYTEPFGSYSDNLRRFVGETRELGATPILMSPICRRRFDGEGKRVDTHGDYPAAVAAVAKELNVLYIDMEALSAELLTSLGEEESSSLFLHLSAGEHPNYAEGVTDNTHLNPSGAAAHAELFVEELRKSDSPLADWLKPMP